MGPGGLANRVASMDSGTKNAVFICLQLCHAWLLEMKISWYPTLCTFLLKMVGAVVHWKVTEHLSLFFPRQPIRFSVRSQGAAVGKAAQSARSNSKSIAKEVATKESKKEKKFKMKRSPRRSPSKSQPLNTSQV